MTSTAGRTELTPQENLLVQAENMIAAWDRLYALINPRGNFPLAFADLAEDTEFREVLWLRAALAATKTGGAS